MANNLKGKILYIDTFTSAIDLSDQFPSGCKLVSIEWIGPTDTDHTAQVRIGSASGPIIFSKTCAVANECYEKRYDGMHIDSLYIPVAAGNLLASGSLIIVTKAGNTI